ncbi:MAG: hypothetical protein U0586_14795 [Candidatus Brocadiaceae bacterium]
MHHRWKIALFNHRLEEVFQKTLAATVKVEWQSDPAPFNNKTVNVKTDYLLAGVWQPPSIPEPTTTITSSSFPLLGGGYSPYIDAPDLSESVHYNSSSRHGFVRLKLDNDFGQNEYEQALSAYIKKVVDKTLTDNDIKPLPPIRPPRDRTNTGLHSNTINNPQQCKQI